MARERIKTAPAMFTTANKQHASQTLQATTEARVNPNIKITKRTELPSRVTSCPVQTTRMHDEDVLRSDPGLLKNITAEVFVVFESFL